MLVRRGCSMKLLSALVFLACAADAIAQQRVAGASISQFELQRAHLMLRQAHDDLQKNYYDTTFHGVDINKTFEQFDARLNQSKSISESYRVIAAYMLNLHDSHTAFLPPTRKNRVTPGYLMQMIGDKCFITHIQPGSDAAKKLHVGDQVLALHGFKITPDQFHNIEYFVQVLSPSGGEQLDLLSPTGERRQEMVGTQVVMGQAILDMNDSGAYWKEVREEEEGVFLGRARWFEVGDSLIWQLPSFEFDPGDMDKAFGKASKHQNLVLDLRGNPGGSIEFLKNFTGHFFDHPVKIGDVDARKDNKPMMAKPMGPRFTGKLIVLIDRNSASCAELFAKTIQLEHRGTVIGDHSAGAVMEARTYTEKTGTDYEVYYAFEITSANILMTDGKSLENVGVTPDEVVVPTAADLAAGRDVVLAHAAELAGVKLDPVDAGRHFPYEWPQL